MAETLDRVEFPELVIGIAGPIGVDLDAITDGISAALLPLGYRAIPIKLTAEMLQFEAEIAKPEVRNFYNDTRFKMDYANKLCEKYNVRSSMASIGIRAIHNTRRLANERSNSAIDPDTPLESTAYIVRQLKRPQEVELFRKVYGRQFVLVSAYGSLESRRRIVESKLKRSEVDPGNWTGIGVT
jgi:hypothetical protein